MNFGPSSLRRSIDFKLKGVPTLLDVDQLILQYPKSNHLPTRKKQFVSINKAKRNRAILDIETVDKDFFIKSQQKSKLKQSMQSQKGNNQTKQSKQDVSLPYRSILKKDPRLISTDKFYSLTKKIYGDDSVQKKSIDVKGRFHEQGDKKRTWTPKVESKTSSNCGVKSKGLKIENRQFSENQDSPKNKIMKIEKNTDQTNWEQEAKILRKQVELKKKRIRQLQSMLQISQRKPMQSPFSDYITEKKERLKKSTHYIQYIFVGLPKKQYSFTQQFAISVDKTNQKDMQSLKQTTFFHSNNHSEMATNILASNSSSVYFDRKGDLTESIIFHDDSPQQTTQEVTISQMIYSSRKTRQDNLYDVDDLTLSVSQVSQMKKSKDVIEKNNKKGKLRKISESSDEQIQIVIVDQKLEGKCEG